jgi:hypothetical protein
VGLGYAGKTKKSKNFNFLQNNNNRKKQEKQQQETQEQETQQQETTQTTTQQETQTWVANSRGQINYNHWSRYFQRGHDKVDKVGYQKRFV